MLKGDPILAACVGRTEVFGEYVRTRRGLIQVKTKCVDLKRLPKKAYVELTDFVHEFVYHVWVPNVKGYECYEIGLGNVPTDFTVNTLTYRVHTNELQMSDTVRKAIRDKVLEIDFFNGDPQTLKKLWGMRRLWQRGYRPKNPLNFGDVVTKLIKLRDHTPNLVCADDITKPSCDAPGECVTGMHVWDELTLQHFREDETMQEIVEACGIKL